MNKRELEQKVAQLEGRIAELEGTGTTHVAIVQDKSGSMSHLRDDTIGGLNSYIRDLREETPEGKVEVTLTQFDSSVRTVWEATPLHLVEDLTTSQYRPSGTTALYDALGSSIQLTSKTMKPGDRVLVIVMTDGYENSSREFSQERIFDLIKSKTELGNWTFVYLGADVDAWAAGSSLGFYKGNTHSYAGTSAGTASTFSSLTSNSGAYFRSADSSSKSFTDGMGDTATDDSKLWTPKKEEKDAE